MGSTRAGCSSLQARRAHRVWGHGMRNTPSQLHMGVSGRGPAAHVRAFWARAYVRAWVAYQAQPPPLARRRRAHGGRAARRRPRGTCRRRPARRSGRGSRLLVFAQLEEAVGLRAPTRAAVTRRPCDLSALGRAAPLKREGQPNQTCMVVNCSEHGVTGRAPRTLHPCPGQLATRDATQPARWRRRYSARAGYLRVVLEARRRRRAARLPRAAPRAAAALPQPGRAPRRSAALRARLCARLRAPARQPL